jgi:hypothetical protein
VPGAAFSWWIAVPASRRKETPDAALAQPHRNKQSTVAKAMRNRSRATQIGVLVWQINRHLPHASRCRTKQRRIALYQKQVATATDRQSNVNIPEIPPMSSRRSGTLQGRVFFHAFLL